MVKSKGEAMIVDTGFNTEEIKSEMLSFMKDMEVDYDKTILFLTHLHSDHTGLASWFHEELGIEIYMGDIDYRMMSSMADANSKRWKEVMETTHIQGLEEDNLKIEEHSGFVYRPRAEFPYVSFNPNYI